jgi:hypothetical protein
MPTTPEDLPRGFNEGRGRETYLRMRIERGHTQAAEILAREQRDGGFSTLLFTPEEGRLYDAGFENFGEFFCSLETAKSILQDGMTIDGVPGTIQVVYRFMNGAQLYWQRT